jgi:hypothetical protein
MQLRGFKRSLLKILQVVQLRMLSRLVNHFVRDVNAKAFIVVVVIGMILCGIK